MLLRDHPLMTYKGERSWPPTWLWIDGPKKNRATGEIGILRSVLLSKLQPANRCFLLIFHEESSYLGCLLFDNEIFCRQITKLLQSYCNHSIAEIGSLNISHTLLEVSAHGFDIWGKVARGKMQAKAIIPELRLNAENAHQLTHNVANLLTVQRLLREQIHPTHTTLRVQSSASRKTNNVVSLGNITEEKEPPEPPPDEDESKPPIEEPPTEEPPVKEPSQKNH